MAFKLRQSVTFVDHTVDQEIKDFRGVEFSRFVPCVRTIWTIAWSVLNVQSATKYRENQVSLAVTLWLSVVVIDRTFTSEGVDVRVCKLIH